MIEDFAYVVLWFSGLLVGYGLRGLLRERRERIHGVDGHGGHVHEWEVATVLDRRDLDFWICLSCAKVSPGPTDNEHLDPRRSS